MENMKDNLRITKIQDVPFQEPDAAIQTLLRKYHRKDHLAVAVISTVILIALIVCSVFIRKYRPVFLILAVFFAMPVSFSYLKGLLFLPKYTVRSGTVTEYERTFESNMNDGHKTVHLVTLRLDDSCETVRQVPVEMHLMPEDPVGIQVVLCRRKNNEYSIFPAQEQKSASGGL